MSSNLHPAIASFAKEHKKQYSAILRAIKRYQKIAVFRHIRPDFDAMGSQMGLVTWLKDNFPDKEIHYLGDNHPTFTGRIFPKTETLNNEWFSDGDFLAIIVDVGDKERIADPRYIKAKYKVKIDHHPCKKEIAPHATVCVLESASAAELVADFCLSQKGYAFSKEAARYFYIGIVGDSGRFMFSTTSVHTFAVAEELLKTGIKISDIYLEMYEKDIQSLKNQAYVLSHFDVTSHGVAYYLLPIEVQQEMRITTEQGKEHVNLFSNIQGINAWCSITQDVDKKEPCWRISIRSKKEDISGVANRWGGGGHKQASGAKIKDLTELNAFLKDLDDLFA